MIDMNLISYFNSVCHIVSRLYALSFDIPVQQQLIIPAVHYVHLAEIIIFVIIRSIDSIHYLRSTNTDTNSKCSQLGVVIVVWLTVGQQTILRQSFVWRTTDLTYASVGTDSRCSYMLDHPFISTRLDYSNTVLHSATGSLLTLRCPSIFYTF